MQTNLIENAFKDAGYIEIPFQLNGAGHPMIEVTINKNHKSNIMLDTGASANLLDTTFSRGIGLNLVETGEKGGGAGGLTLDVFSIGEVDIEIKGELVKISDFIAMDFTTIRESLTVHGLSADFNGILGFGFFKLTKSFIDYSGDRIFIKTQD